MLRALLDAAVIFAMELEAPAGHDGGFGTLDRSTAVTELARIGEHRPELLVEARSTVDPRAEPVAAALLGIASVWIVFAGDD